LLLNSGVTLYLEGPGGLFEFIRKRLTENGHMVIVIAEGAGQELISETLSATNMKDASGNKLLQDVGLWLSQKIKVEHLKSVYSLLNELFFPAIWLTILKYVTFKNLKKNHM